MGPWVLILYISTNAMTEGEAVALTHVNGFQTEQACQLAGRKAAGMVDGSFKSSKFVCVNQEDLKAKKKGS